MSDTPTNHFSRKCEILADIWLNYRDDEALKDFIEYNDIGIPLAYIISEGLATPVELSEKYVEETYSLLLESLGLEDSEDWDSLDGMFGEISLRKEDPDNWPEYK
jgi:hypothetical protein